MDQVDKLTNQGSDVAKQRIQSRENITKEVIKQIGNRQNVQCPYLFGENRELVELTRDPNEPLNEPFGWPKGTLRGMLTIWVTIGFLLITMLIIFLLPLSLVMVMEIWKVLAGIFGLVVASYFYSRIKMGGGLFR